MIRSPLAALVAALLLGSGCSNSPTTPTTPDTNPTTVTDTFSGTLTRNGASSYAFSVSAAGLVYATLTTVSDSSVVVGLSLGTWSGTSCTVTSLYNDQAVQGTTITGSASSQGNLCVRVYDAAAKIVSPVDYQVTVVHP